MNVYTEQAEESVPSIWGILLDSLIQNSKIYIAEYWSEYIWSVKIPQTHLSDQWMQDELEARISFAWRYMFRGSLSPLSWIVITWHRVRLAQQCWAQWCMRRRPWGQWQWTRMPSLSGWSPPRAGSPGSDIQWEPPIPHSTRCRSHTPNTGRWRSAERQGQSELWATETAVCLENWPQWWGCSWGGQCECA